MNNGCICCTVRGDLIRILANLLKRRKNLDGIIIETTGLADPAPVIQTFYMDDDVREKTELDAVVTVADAANLLKRLEDSDEAKEQIAFADVILLNKTDLASPLDLNKVEFKIKTINPYARVVRTERCQVPLPEVLGKKAFDLSRVLAVEPDFLAPDGAHHDHVHDSSITHVALTHGGEVDFEAFQDFLVPYLRDFGQDVLRCKGVLALPGEPLRRVFQGVHMLLEMTEGLPWKDGEKRVSKAVFIGRNLDEAKLAAGFEAAKR